MTVLRDEQRLFQEAELHDYLEQRKSQAMAEVGRYEASVLLNMPLQDAASTLIERFRMLPIELDEAGIAADQNEGQIETSRIPDGRWLYGDHQATVSGTQFRFYIPFRGDAALFRLRSSSWGTNPPRGTISGSELVMSFSTASPDAPAIKTQLQQQVTAARQCIQNQRGQIDEFNRILVGQVPERLQARKDQLLKAANTVAAIGFPLRTRPGMPTTFVAPEVRRKIAVTAPKPLAVASAPFRPEPALDSGDYEHIIGVVENMALVLERSPSAFKTMGEEDLRQQFLVQLNGHYEGSATAETFNVGGKTDILIRSEGKNIFIAECKFWKGPAGFTETIDQLLGYVAWRDTKTAIFVFNRDTQMSTVVEKIPALLQSHPNYKRTISSQKDAQFRAVFSHKGDASRELTLTVLVFDVPR